MILHVTKPAISDFAEAELYSYSGISVMSLYLMALSSYLPVAEAIINSHMSRYAKSQDMFLSIDEKALIQDFIRQESNHSRYHVLWNKAITKRRPEMKVVFSRFDAMNQSVLRLVEKRHPGFTDLQRTLFDTCAFELVTSAYAKLAMQHIVPQLKGVEKELWRWHCVEEIEHAFVSEHFYNKAPGVSLFYQIRIMLRVMIVLNLLMLQRITLAARADRQLSLWRFSRDLFSFCLLQPGGLLPLNWIILKGFWRLIRFRRVNSEPATVASPTRL